MSYADELLRRNDAAVDDEYQAQINHRSATVGLAYTFWATLVTGAILAWLLPGWQSLTSILVYLPIVTGIVAGQQWMKTRAPRPRAIRLTAGEWALTIPILAVWLAGAFVRGFGGEPAAGLGMICGGVIGGLLGGWLSIRGASAARRRDETRLDAELAD